MDHIQKEPPLNLKGTPGHQSSRQGVHTSARIRRHFDDRLKSVCSAQFLVFVVACCAASRAHADGFDRTAVRNPNTRTALLTFAVK